MKITVEPIGALHPSFVQELTTLLLSLKMYSLVEITEDEHVSTFTVMPKNPRRNP